MVKQGLRCSIYFLTLLFGISAVSSAVLLRNKSLELVIFVLLLCLSVGLIIKTRKDRKQSSLLEAGNKRAPWTVLVIDDDLTFTKLVKSHFLKQKVNVVSAESGERGLELAKRHMPDLIILDVILPNIKGREVCAKLKEDILTANIPVMFVTFKNSLDDISAEMELGAVMHLTKPVNYDHLYQQVHKILVKG